GVTMGPVVEILFPNTMTAETQSAIRASILKMATGFEDDDFTVQGRPFSLTFGEHDEGALDEHINSGAAAILGWAPRDTLTILAGCNGSEDHRIIAQLTLMILRDFGGLVEFCGALHPFEGDLQTLYNEKMIGGQLSWPDWEPHFRKAFKDVKGKLYALPYEV